jgi:DTW domain-containing protein
MGKRERAKNRCQHCLMSVSLCICSEIPTIVTQTHVVIVMHHREVKMPTNTGRLAHQCLVGSKLVLRGLKDSPADVSTLVSTNTTPLLLHPCDDAISLDEHFTAKIPPPYTLIVPDGSWRQASKVGTREEGLRDVQRVMLRMGAPTQYKLRKETKQDGLATLEAIARALGVLDSPEVEAKLTEIFRVMVSRTLRSRGVS